jgi:hypothetical protein
MTNINLVHVSALACHPQGVFPLKAIHAQHANTGMCHPEWNDEYIKILKYKKSISIKLRRYNFMLINYTPCNISEESRPDLHCGRSLKAPKCH